MGNSPPITAQVRQQLEGFAEVEERELLLKIEKTIEQTPLKYLFEDCPLHHQVVNALILHVEVFVERIFDFTVSLDLGQPVEQVISDAVNRAVLVLYGLHGFFEKFGLAREAAQKFKALELRNADLLLPNLMERLKSGLESKVNHAVPRLKSNDETSEQAGMSQKLSGESIAKMDERAQVSLPAVAESFKSYAKLVGAIEWARYEDGETERFVDFFVAMARDVVAAGLGANSDPFEEQRPAFECAVLNRIKGACMIPLLPPTWPWRTSELFENRDFLEAMRTMIHREVALRSKPETAQLLTPIRSDFSNGFDSPENNFDIRSQCPMMTEKDSLEHEIQNIISQCSMLGEMRVLPDELQPELSFAFRKLARKMVEAEAAVVCAFPPREFRDRLRVRVPEIRSACMESFYRLTKGVATREGASDPGSAAGNLRMWIAGEIYDAVRGKVDELTSEPDGELSAEAQAVIRKKLDAASAIVKSAVDRVADETTGLEEAARELEWKALLWAYDYFHEILNQWSLKGIPPTEFELLAKAKADEVAEYAADHFCVHCKPEGTDGFTPMLIGLRTGVASPGAPNISNRGHIFERVREALSSYPDQYRKENEFRYNATTLPKPDEARRPKSTGLHDGDANGTERKPEEDNLENLQKTRTGVNPHRDRANQPSELPQTLGVPLPSEGIRPDRELPPEPEVGAAARPARGNHRLFRRNGDVWELAFDGETVHVRYSKGMEYIAHLLRSPDQDVYSGQLFMAIAGEPVTPILTSAGEVLDSVALTQYRSRIEDLESQLDQAERNNDQGHKEAAQAELHRLQEQVISAEGLGGRPRNAHDDADKIRKAVGIAIERAIASIREHHPALAAYLKLRIKRGTFLRYQGDGIDWQF